MAEEKLHHIYLYGDVDPYWGGVSAMNVVDQLKEKSKSEYDTLIVHVNSPGGEVYEGYTIYNIFKSFDKPIEFQIEGMCASIMTLIVLAPGENNKVVMEKEFTKFMIHNAWSFAGGDQNDLREVADQLDEIKETILSVYEAKTGLDRETLSKMMDDETFMTAEEAKSFGFIDETFERLRAVARVDKEKIKNNITLKKMSDKKDTTKAKSKLVALVNKMTAVLSGDSASNQQTEKPTSLLIELEDGETTLYVFTEDGEIVDKRVVIADAEGNPTEQAAPDGEHRLNDNRVITIEDGIITAVTEAEAEGANVEERLTALEDAIESLTDPINNIIQKLSDMNTIEPNVMAKVEEKNTETYGELKNDLEEMRNLLNEVYPDYVPPIKQDIESKQKNSKEEDAIVKLRKEQQSADKKSKK